MLLTPTSTNELRSRRRYRVIADGLLLRRTEEFRMQVLSPFLRGLFFFHLNAMCIGIGIVADPRNLPGDLHVGTAGPDGESVATDLLCHDGLELSDDRKLVTKIAVQGFEVIRQAHNREAAPVRSDVALPALAVDCWASTGSTQLSNRVM